jgi:hypothetical protein
MCRGADARRVRRRVVRIRQRDRRHDRRGQNVDLNGGEWYVIRPSGQPLIPAP